MRSIRSILLGLVGVFLLAACSDLPTVPQPVVADLDGPAAAGYDQADGCVSDGFCILPPITVSPGDECDPWMSLDWCSGGGNCEEAVPGDPETSSVESCPGGGGPGDSDPGTGAPGGGTSPPGGDDPPPPPCPDWDPYCEQQEPQPDQCDTGDPIVDSPDVYGQFAELWARSVENNVEQGGWIVHVEGGYRLVPFQMASADTCEMRIEGSPPAGTVAMVHTHPWPLFSVNPCGYLNTGTPSDEDREALRILGLSTGYLLDGAGVGKYTADGGESSERLGRCGY